MATRAELMQALRDADAAGDTEATAAITRLIQAQEAAPQQPVGEGTVLAPKAEPYMPSWERDPEEFERRRQAAVEESNEQYSPTKGQSFGQNVLQGTGRAFDKMGGGVRQLWNYATGDEEEYARLQKEEEQQRALDDPLMSTGGGKVGYYGTEAGMALLPASKLAKIPAVARGGRAALAASEAGLGAVQGALQPTVEGESHGTNAAIGGTIGAALPYVKPAAAALNRGVARLPLVGAGSRQMLEMSDRAAGRAAKEAAQKASLANQEANRQFKAAALRQKAEEKAANLAAKEMAAATRQRAAQVIENQTGRLSGTMPVSQDFAKRMASLSRHYGEELPESFHRAARQVNVPGMVNVRVPYQAVAQLKSDLGSAARAASASRQSASALHKAEREVAQGMLETLPKRRAAALRTAYSEYGSGVSASARRGVKKPPVTPGPVQVPIPVPGRGQAAMQNMMDYTKGMPAVLRRQLLRNVAYDLYPNEEQGE